MLDDTATTTSHDIVDYCTVVHTVPDCFALLESGDFLRRRIKEVDKRYLNGGERRSWPSVVGLRPN